MGLPRALTPRGGLARVRLRFLRAGGHLLPVLVCALCAHVLLFRSLVPTEGTHRYLRWYEPIVAGLSLASLLALGALAVISVVGGERARRTVSRLSASCAGAKAGSPDRAARLAIASGAFLVAQETVERSIGAGRPSPAAFSPGQVLLILLSLAVLAGVVARVERWCRQLVALVARRSPTSRVRLRNLEVGRCRYSPPRWMRRRPPLAERRGLRAPPEPVRAA